MMRKTPGCGVLLSILLLSCTASFAQDTTGHGAWNSPTIQGHPATDPRTTFERLLPLAEAGDPDVQNLLGFMYFYSEGVELDYDQAHHWFHQAAEQGNLLAQRNLGLLHSKSRAKIPVGFYDPLEANYWFSLYAAGVPGGSRLASSSYQSFLGPVSEGQNMPLGNRETGKEVYVTFCAGCHGFEDRAAFPNAPSLLLGEKLQQVDSELIASILDGKNNIMPAWRETITEEQAREVVLYIRNRFVSRQVRTVDSIDASIHQTTTNAQDLGEMTYTRFCGGCHGFNGISYYVNSPSFALRERMHKSDSQLAESISGGRGVMPSWEDMLSSAQIESLVRFIRTLAPAYEAGIDHDLRITPELYFLFRPLGETTDDWHVRRDQ